MRPSVQEPTSFEKSFSDKLHSKLVPRNRKPQKSKLPDTSLTLACPTNVVGSAQRSKIDAAIESLTSKTLPLGGEDEITVQGSKHKAAILQEYSATFGEAYSTPIVTEKKGKTYQCISEKKITFMRPSIGIQYRVDELSINNVITTVMKVITFDKSDLHSLSCTGKLFARLIPKTLRWLTIDFSPLREPRYNYELQKEISQHRVDMASAAMVHFGLEIGKVMRYLKGEYIGANRDVRRTLAAVKGHITDSDYNHLERILTNGCPSRLNFDETLQNKTRMINRGNSKSFNENPDLVKKTLNKEDRYSHILPMDEDMPLISPSCRHTPQGLITKQGKNPRLVWDASTMKKPDDVVMNNITSIDHEAPITFGNSKKLYLQDIWDARVRHPDTPILQATADIKACFRFGRIHADLTGAFGFVAGGHFNASVGMVFGSNTSAPSFEPVRRSIEVLSLVYANRPDLVIKHQRYLDMIQWSVRDPNVKLTPAVESNNTEGRSPNSNDTIQRPARIYVDDALLFALSVDKMKMALAALIEAIFVVMGEPNTEIRQCPLAMDKWVLLQVNTVQPLLGLVIDTDRMMVAIPNTYTEEVCDLINTTWHTSRKSFTVMEAQRLTGKLGHLAQGATWVFHLLTHLYTSIAKALASNKLLLSQSSREFQNIVRSLRTGQFPCPAAEQSKHIAFAMKQMARLPHHAKFKYIIGPDMQREIDFFREKLCPSSDIAWETPIAHMVPREPTATAFGDSSLEGAGGYSIGLNFWWHISFPEEVKRRTLLHMKDNKDGTLISINVLEFVTVIINYIAALHVIRTTNITNDPYPVLLNVTDNTSALNWTLNACRKSKIGKLLSRFFCSLLINSPLGINSQWISTHENNIADDISRLKTSLDEYSRLTFDYSSLQQSYPQLSHCSFFQLQPELTSLIWQIVLHEKWPCHEEIKILRQQPLGSLTTSFGAK